MLVYASHLLGTPVLSMQASDRVAFISSLVVDPNSLKILAFRVAGPLVDRNCSILAVKSIREYSAFGCVIDSIDELASDDDIIKVKNILELNFDLIGLKVETKKGTKLGRVQDFTVTSEDFTVQQLVVKRPLVKSFLDPELLIPRKEIVEITDYKVIVKDEESAIKKQAKEDFIPNFVNPFRTTHKPAPAPSRTGTPAGTDKR